MDLIPIPNGEFEMMEEKSLSEVARDVVEQTRELYLSGGYLPPWIGYLSFIDEQYVGSCAFKSPPVNGTVEIAYYTFPEYEGHGHATQMGLALITIAQKTSPGIRIIAQTMPETNASTSILKKLGFQYEKTLQLEEDCAVWQWLYQAPAGKHA